MEFNSRYQKSKESVDRFIDALEALCARIRKREMEKSYRDLWQE